MAVNNQEVVAPGGPQGPGDGMSFPLGAVNQEGSSDREIATEYELNTRI